MLTEPFEKKLRISDEIGQFLPCLETLFLNRWSQKAGNGLKLNLNAYMENRNVNVVHSG